jgi:hypothetical protein
MVTTPIDFLKIPTLNLSIEELDAAQAEIDAGTLPANWFDLYADALEKNIFGHDHKKDKRGAPIEQGLGSEFGMTRNSINAYRKFCSNDPDFEKNVARMEKQLVAANERRKAETPATHQRSRGIFRR